MSVKITPASTYRRNNPSLSASVMSAVDSILSDVMAKGDSAVIEWSEKIDGFEPRWIELKPFKNYELDPELSQALQFAKQRITAFAEFQMQQYQPAFFEDSVGRFGFSYQALDSMAAYIPAGRFPLVSSALMTLVPAQVAGCKTRIACSPSNSKEILAAASLAGADRFLHLGGAQAIAALSYGFDGQKAVDMIVGPGNAYVNAAKAQVMSRTSIDSLAGPSEVLIYANELENPDWIIADALAQAEHDEDAMSLIVSCKETLLNELATKLNSDSKTQDLVSNQQVALILCEDNHQAIEFINDYAPEHLMLCDSSIRPGQLNNYGALFLGENSAVAFGDYCSGPNHTLPTAGMAKRMSGLGVHSFLKVQTHQQIKGPISSELRNCAERLSKTEGLNFHNASVIKRM